MVILKQRNQIGFRINFLSRNSAKRKFCGMTAVDDGVMVFYCGMTTVLCRETNWIPAFAGMTRWW